MPGMTSSKSLVVGASKGTSRDGNIAQQLNQLIPICRLPNEVLSSIFEHLPANPFVYNANYHQMLTVTAVCRHFRYVAIACPRLWSLIDCKFKRDLVQVLLLRSRAAPLFVYCRRIGFTLVGSGRENMTLVMKESYRISEMHIDFEDGDSIFQLIQDPMPRLRILSITGPPPPSRAFPVALTNSLTRLKELELHYIHLPEDTASLVNVKVLKLSSDVDQLDLLAAFQWMPQVSAVDICTRGLAPLPNSPSHEPVERDLQFLRSLHLRLYNVNVEAPLEYTLSRMRCPRLRSFDLMFPLKSSISWSLASAIADKCSIAMARSAGSACVSIAIDQNFEMKLSTVNPKKSSRAARLCSVSIWYPGGAPAWSGVPNPKAMKGCRLAKLLEPKRQVRTLKVSGARSLSSERWREYFGEFGRIRTLDVDSPSGILDALGSSLSAKEAGIKSSIDHALDSLDDALVTPEARDHNATKDGGARRATDERKQEAHCGKLDRTVPDIEADRCHSFFPELHHLIIRNWAFQEPVKAATGDQYQLLERLQDCLIRRSLDNTPIQKLTLENCRLDEKDLNVLRKHVPLLKLG